MRAARPVVERVLKFPALNQVYLDACRGRTDEREGTFFERVSKVLGMQLDVDEEQLARVPQSGPLVVVANHPLGGLEGILLPALLNRVRPDIKVVSNYLLSCMPEMHDVSFFVDPFGKPTSTERNFAAMRSILRWVRDGGAIATFPAGEVSHLHWRQRRVVDPAWDATIAKIVQRAEAAVLPVFVDGRNSNLFQMMGLIHPRLRTAMLPRELLKKRNGTIRMRIGSPLTSARTKRFKDPAELTDYMRVRTYILKKNRKEDTPPRAEIIDRPGYARIVDPVSPEVVADEIAGLPKDQFMLESGEQQVYFARSSQAPNLLRELGRLREIAFRQVGEGTGFELDIDRFDEHYLHLFIWHKTEAKIVGAYRLGLTDEILPRFGKAGLYTDTLFRYQQELLDQINPAIELGRSFVHPAFQNSYAPLMLLWKGIGSFIAQNPRYTRLIGPVSISAQYTTMSRHLLVAFLKLNKYLPALGKLIHPKNPPEFSPDRDWDARQFSTVIRDLDEVNDLISDLESDRKRMPVLLRQYLKLNAQLLGFNVDPEFGDALDGLMLVDATTTDRRTMIRYMGREATNKFLAYHGLD